jgi:hypothetical protein
MDGHLVLASSDSKIGCSLENFTMDAERWLAALYWSYGRLMATMQPMLWQTAGCESSKND